MAGHRATKFLMNHVFPEYPLVVDNIMAFDAKNRYKSVLREMEHKIADNSPINAIAKFCSLLNEFRNYDSDTLHAEMAMYPVDTGLNEDVFPLVYDIMAEIIKVFEDFKYSENPYEYCENFYECYRELLRQVSDMSYWSVRVVGRMMKYTVSRMEFYRYVESRETS